jgi:putative cell wall-binding protein
MEDCSLTLNTTRICSVDAIGTSIEVSRMSFTNMKPNAVILVNENEAFDAITSTSLVHFPINASLLFTDGNSLSKETLYEIKRLSPKGYKGIHVILIGNISKNVSSALNSCGFKTRHIGGRNHYETACVIPSVRKEFKNILIISGEDYSEGIITGYWSAHHGDPILYTRKNSIPCCTLEVIKKMKDINIYIIGSTKTVSKAVENYLCNLGNVKHLERIDGENSYDIAVNFAKYKDPKTDFGWGRNYKEGHAFTFGDLNHPMEIVAGVVFAHMGKHTPLLLTQKDKVPAVVKKYIKLVKPMIPEDMPSPPFMHGFILGSTQNINYNTQVMIEELLSIDHEMTDMEHNMCEKEHMHKMHHPDHMMEMEHDMCEAEHMHKMHYPDHMIEMEHDMHDTEHVHDTNYDEDEKNEEIYHESKHKISENHTLERSNSNYRRISIDQILE